MKTSLEIKQTLIQIAEKLGRPHYELAVVRDVIRAFQTGADHPLKDAVLNPSSVSKFKKPVKWNCFSETGCDCAWCSSLGRMRYLARKYGKAA